MVPLAKGKVQFGTFYFSEGTIPTFIIIISTDLLFKYSTQLDHIYLQGLLGITIPEILIIKEPKPKVCITLVV